MGARQPPPSRRNAGGRDFFIIIRVSLSLRGN
jgi:hypothetical protein